MAYFIVICGFIVATYTLLLIIGLVIWLQIKPLPEPVCLPCLKTNITVIVPFRNEIDQLINLLESLRFQDIPNNLVHIILVNDHSENVQLDKLKSYLKSYTLSLELINLVQDEGKKSAISIGVKQSNTELIACTDADSIVPPGWLSAIVDIYEHTMAKFIIGQVVYTSDKSTWQNMQQIEFASLIGSSAVAASMGLPNMCNGANMAFAKSAFVEVGGYDGNDKVQSGDDIFLMHKIYNKYPDAVKYLHNRLAVVETQPSHRFSDFLNQRNRWASKWMKYENVSTILLAIYIFIVNMSAATLIILWPFNLYLIGVVLLARWIFEYIFLYAILRFLNKTLHLKDFIPLILVYPFYVVFFALSSQVVTYQWKGRKSNIFK
ncbi:MAG: glycosyltransferase [Bacteroidota bacterium]|nr:glycosyltransferase [Bacteroidota bacterium]